MAVLQVHQIYHAYGQQELLHNASLLLNEKSRATLVGKNGSGKSTLMKIISGLLEPDAGTINTDKTSIISYLPQTEVVNEHHTLYEEAEKGYRRFKPLLAEMKALELQMSQTTTEREALALAARLDAGQQSLLESSYWQREAIISQILLGLGFTQEDFQRPCSEFSGGWVMRIALAKVLIEKPDFMLLDEPTNYLDIEARTWLKSHLKQFQGGLLIVSHDQDFLDELVNEVYHLERGQLRRYSGNYSAFRVQQETELARLRKMQQQQEREIERHEQFITRFRSTDSRARQVQSRIKQLEKLKLVELPKSSRDLSFSFPKCARSGNEVLHLAEVSKSYQDLHLFRDFSLTVERKERLAIAGRNGTGKSTLLRIMAGVDPSYQGQCTRGVNVTLGYFAQDAEKHLDGSLTVLEEAQRSASTADIPRLRGLLGSFLFGEDDINKQVSVLSGGEKSRLALLKLLLQPANLLILDEPTSHLDIESKQMLLAALEHYDGTLIFVSHDTHFIKHLATKILYLTDHLEYELFSGDYDYFSWKLQQKEEHPLPQANLAETKAPSVSNLERQEANRRRNRLRSLQNEGEKIIHRSHTLEAKLEALNAKLNLEENYSDYERAQQLSNQKLTLQEEIDNLAERYFELHQLIEELEQEHG